MSYRDRWTVDHGADGLRPKFAVYKTADRIVEYGRPRGNIPAVDGFVQDARIGEDGEFVFVLRPESDREAVLALGAYALYVRERAPQLSAGILEQLVRIVAANGR